jgi:hypothetical protein
MRHRHEYLPAPLVCDLLRCKVRGFHAAERVRLCREAFESAPGDCLGHSFGMTSVSAGQTSALAPVPASDEALVRRLRTAQRAESSSRRAPFAAFHTSAVCRYTDLPLLFRWRRYRPAHRAVFESYSLAVNRLDPGYDGDACGPIDGQTTDRVDSQSTIS